MTDFSQVKWRRLALLSVCSGIIVSVVATTSHSQTNNAYPMIMHCQPAAVRIGETAEVEVYARYNLNGATAVLVSGNGVEAEVINEDNPSTKSPEYAMATFFPRLYLLQRFVRKQFSKPGNDESLRNDLLASQALVRFRVSNDATPGVRDFRIMTPHGASTVGQLVLVRDTVVLESSSNNSMSEAMAVSLPATLCGSIDRSEDVDYFQFHAEAGSRWIFHVRAQRLLDRLHDMQTRMDPILTLRNASGSTLAASDNYFSGDPLLAYEFEHSGTYFLEIRDVRYQGNADWVYVIEAHSRPFVTQVHPLALTGGQESTVELIGWNLESPALASIAIGPQQQRTLETVVPRSEWPNLNEVAVAATPFRVQVESDDNTASTSIEGKEAAGQASDPSLTETRPAKEFSVPGVWCGRIRTPGEVDRYPFEGKANEKLSFEVLARRANSELDAVVRIVNDQGQVLLEVDDATVHRMVVADSWIENWNVPADGRYFLEVRDLHDRGGDSFTYAVRAERATPRFELQLDTDKTLLAPGMGSVLYVRALRKNGFAGEIQLHVDGLPPGVDAQAGRILAELQDGCILFQAHADATMGAANIVVRGSSTIVGSDGIETHIESIAQPMQEIYLPGGGRGNYPVDFHTVSVARPMDIRAISVHPSDIELRPGDSQRVDITIERAPDFKGTVSLDLIFQHLEQPYGNTLPKGVSIDAASSKTILSPSENAGFITLKADAAANSVERQLVPVNAHVSINFVMKHTFCTEPLWVTVRKPD